MRILITSIGGTLVPLLIKYLKKDKQLKNIFPTLKISTLSTDINEISNKEIATIKKETSLDKLREELKKGNISYYPSKRKDNWKLFREGKVNSWKNHFNDNQIKDIEKIESGFFSIFSRIIYYVIFTLRRLIFRIE